MKARLPGQTSEVENVFPLLPQKLQGNRRVSFLLFTATPRHGTYDHSQLSPTFSLSLLTPSLSSLVTPLHSLTSSASHSWCSSPSQFLSSFLGIQLLLRRCFQNHELFSFVTSTPTTFSVFVPETPVLCSYPWTFTQTVSSAWNILPTLPHCTATSFLFGQQNSLPWPPHWRSILCFILSWSLLFPFKSLSQLVITYSLIVIYIM